jgi:hypothetical protein
MRKVIALIVIFAAITFGWTTSTISPTKITYDGQFIIMEFGYMVVSTGLLQKQAFVDISKWKTIDSITCSVFGYGELDIDSVDIYVGSNGAFGSTAYTMKSTLDLAASTKGFVTANPAVTADIINQSILRGVTSLKVITRGSAAGCSTGNNAFVMLHIWGTQ